MARYDREVYLNIVQGVPFVQRNVARLHQNKRVLVGDSDCVEMLYRADRGCLDVLGNGRKILSQLTTESRLYIAAHGEFGNTENLYDQSGNQFSIKDLVANLYPYLRDGDFLNKASARKLRVSLLICYAAQFRVDPVSHSIDDFMALRFYLEMRKYGIYCDVIARRGNVRSIGEKNTQYESFLPRKAKFVAPDASTTPEELSELIHKFGRHPDQTKLMITNWGEHTVIYNGYRESLYKTIRYEVIPKIRLAALQQDALQAGFYEGLVVPIISELYQLSDREWQRIMDARFAEAELKKNRFTVKSSDAYCQGKTVFLVKLKDYPAKGVSLLIAPAMKIISDCMQRCDSDVLQQALKESLDMLAEYSH